MKIKDALLAALEDLNGGPSTNGEIYRQIIHKQYYDFGDGKTPRSTVSAQLGDFVRKGDSRVKRIKGARGRYKYYLAKHEDEIDTSENEAGLDFTKQDLSPLNKAKSYYERDLHVLLATFLKDTNIFCKTIYHEQSKIATDRNQKWVHPDAVGIKYVTLKNKSTQSLLNAVSRADVFKLYRPVARLLVDK